MLRRVVGVALGNLKDLPKQCRHCVFWEVAPYLQEEARQYGQIDFEKEAWISSVLLEWGSCGRIAYVDSSPVGYAMYAPPSAVPRAATFPTAPVGADAVLLTALRVMPEFAGSGVGRMLVQAVAKDLTKRGVKAVEAFGNARPDLDSHCVIPADFLRAVGFEIVQPHSRWPRLRLELHTALAWKKDVESALEQLFETITIPANPTPALSAAGSR